MDEIKVYCAVVVEEGDIPQLFRSKVDAQSDYELHVCYWHGWTSLQWK